MSDEKLTPERAVRILRAKAGELEAIVLDDDIRGGRGSTDLCADIALIASLLADHIDRSMGNITREMLDSRRPYITKTGKVLTDAQIEEWADEAERGYDVTHKPPSLGMTDDRQPQQQGDTP